MGPTLLSLAVVSLIAYCTLGLMLYLRQPKFLYSPVRELTLTPEEIGLDFECVAFKTADGLTLSGWYIPAEKPGFTVLFCHGNAGNMMHRLDSIDFFCSAGLSCFIFDYRGYGDSQGSPTEQGTYLDAAAAYTWLAEEKKIPPDDIIIFGRSLGGSIAAQLATARRPAALVIESAFTSYVDMGRKFYPYMPVRWFARYRYSTIDYIRDVRCPVMIIHSQNDEIVPFEFALKLYEAANEPKELVEIFGGHNDAFLLSGRVYSDAWTNWLKSLKKYQTRSGRRRAF